MSPEIRVANGFTQMDHGKLQKKAWRRGQYFEVPTCRPPVWPSEVQKLCQIADGDPYNQPTGSRPIGWAETAKAHVDNTHPSDSHCRIPSWTGKPDGAKNAELWTAEKSPQNL